MKKPCNECPYRKDSIKGWLGEDFYNPTRFLEQLEMSDAHPCHKAVDWECDDNDIENAPKCIGALQFMNNSMMRSRYQHIVDLQNEVGKNDEVMQFKHNFIKHHSPK